MLGVGIILFIAFLACINVCLIAKYKADNPFISEHQEHKELSEDEKFILSQMANSDIKTIEEIGLTYQKQLAEICQHSERIRNEDGNKDKNL